MKKKLLTVIVLCAVLMGLIGCSMENSSGIDGEVPQEYAYDEQLSKSEVGESRFFENPFVPATETPVSTFSADVDTASYAYFRKLVLQGYSVSELISTAGQSLRTEEMVNYFDYSGNQPADGDLFGIKAQMAPCPWNNESALMVFALQTEKVTPNTDNNLVFLIDVSGSMASNDKLPLLKKAFSYLVSQLDENDTVSIVTYSGKEEIVLEGCAGSKSELIMNAVAGLEANGSTNGESGLKKAYEIAEKYYKQEGNNRIIMASDGDLNVGISSPEELKNFISGKRDSGVFLSVLGFGTGNFRDENMETLADNGNGVYYYIDSETEAEKVFGRDLLSTLYTVAKDVKLQLTFNPLCVASYRLIGYENRVMNNEDFENDTKDAGEVGAGHSVIVCYELKLTDAAKTSDGEWMKLAVRYKKPDEDISNLNEYTINKSAFTEDPDTDFRFVCAVVETAMLLHQSIYIGNDVTLPQIIASLDTLTLSPEKAQFKTLLQTLVSNK